MSWSKGWSSRSGVGVKVHAKRDELNALFDIDRPGDAADRAVDEGHIVGAEAVIVVFQSDRPILPQRPFDTSARGPADSVFRPLETVILEGVEVVVFITGAGKAAFGIEHPAVPRIADACGRAHQKVGRDLVGRGVAKSHRWHPDRG